MSLIGIIGAMNVEIDSLKAKLTDAFHEAAGNWDFVSGKLAGKDVVVVQCGIGKVNAALCAQYLILKYKPELIINTGVGGSLHSNVRYGDIVIADKVVQHDVDTSPIGDPVGLVSTINKIYFDCDQSAGNALESACRECGIPCVRGIAASGDQFIASKEKKERIVSLFNASVCEMEGGAIGQVCYICNTPFEVIRSISDNADDGSPSDYSTFVKVAAENCCRVLEAFMKKM